MTEDAKTSPPTLPAAPAPAAADDAAALAERLRRVEETLRELTEGQRAMQAQLTALREHTHIIGHLVLEMRHGSRLPVPLERLRDAIVSPRETWRFVEKLKRHSAITSTEVTRASADAPWTASRNAKVYARRLSAALRKGMLGARELRYSVRMRHAPLPVRPRVLHVIPNVFVGGSTQLVIDLHEHLGHRYEMQILTAALPPSGRHQGLVIHHLPLESQAGDFAQVIAAVKPDLVHIHYWGETDRPWYEKALDAVAATKAAIVENVNTPVAPLRHPRIGRYVFVSETIRRIYGADLENAEHVHPGIDLTRFKPPAAWDADANDSIGMVYRLEPDKLDPDAIEPFIAAVKQRPRTRAFIIGDGSLFDTFHDRVAAEGLLDNFVFTGEVPYAELPDYYAKFRLFVAPVARESFGQVTPFAMAMGHAVAGNRIGALPEILQSEETLGRSVEETASIIVGLLDDPERMARLGERNIARARDFAVEGMIARYRGVYAALLGQEADLMPGFPPAKLFAEV